MTGERFIAPVNRESTPSIIARKLREAIAHGELAPGAQLGEAELARELGVSRGPLREATQRLTQEGLLVSIRNRGLFVIELTEEDVHDIYLARTAVERVAAAEIFRRGDHAAAGQRLAEIIETMARASDQQDKAMIGTADLEFHEALVQISGSRRLVRMHETLLTETRMCLTALGDTYSAPDQRVPEHNEIVDGFRTGDGARVDRLLVAHMRDAVTRLAAHATPA
ncbi:GntR family transcriptional regulator [Micromonospora sp. B11E3]|uniref:GntR family transcriptional regulator n=1 Tax=Micromonospora sp. B11E3 TaxID=3153562 RepID=UPI00325F3E17